jgi:hypothetical protein
MVKAIGVAFILVLLFSAIAIMAIGGATFSLYYFAKNKNHQN